MDQEQCNILLVDDDEDDYIMTRDLFSEIEGSHYKLSWAATYDKALQEIQQDHYDVYFLDYRLGEHTGLELLQSAIGNGCNKPMILLTGQDDHEIDVEAMKAGASDYLVKGKFDSSLLERTIRYALEGKRAEEALRQSSEELIKKHEELNKIFRQVEIAKLEWEETMDCVGDIVLLVDDQGRIKRSNKALKDFTGKPYTEILNTDWKSLIPEDQIRVGSILKQGMELFHKTSGRWFILKSYPYRNTTSYGSGTVITLHDSTEIKRVSEELEKKNSELEQANEELKATQAQILQQEKMASIGQLAAGVAHEINNPIGFISSNLGTLDKYIRKVNHFIDLQSGMLESLDGEAKAQIEENRKRLKIDYIKEDLVELIKESQEGTERVRKIVQNLKSFSRVDQAEYKYANINECLESTINIVWNEIKYKAKLKKEYGEIPLTKCYPQQLNQVFMNLLINAAHAIEKQGDITVLTAQENGSIIVSISDTGCGIASEKINRIFEPFFTTKEVGKGTGLGLSISYDIIKKHNGELNVVSEVDKGTTFTAKIPLIIEN